MKPHNRVPSYPDFLKRVTRRGKLYEYFDTGQTINGKRIYRRMPLRSDPSYGGTYASLLAARTTRSNVGAAVTLRHLCAEYQRSPEFKRRSESTQNTYLIYIRHIEEQMGEAEVDDIKRADVRALLDKMADRPGAANMTLVVLRNLMRYAKPRDWIEVDPTDGVMPFETGDNDHEPWPEYLLEEALADDNIGLAVALLYYSAQRIGDVCKMRWNDIRDGYLFVRQEKTGKELDIRIHSILLSYLDASPRTTLTILPGTKGRPMRPATLRAQLQRFAAERGHNIVPHGLRKNAVNALLEAGCSVAETAAISGQTLQMVEHYAKRRNNRRIGSAAILKWEGTKSGNRKHLENMS